MRKVTCTPNMAKGYLLANETRVGEHLLPPGKIIGNDEITWLNDAGIKEIEAIKIGVKDLLANAAVNRLGTTLAINGLLPMPAINGNGHVKAKRDGLLCYPHADLKKSLSAQSDFSVKIKPCFSRVKKSDDCAHITSHLLVHQISHVKDLVLTLPGMGVLPLRPLRVACAYTGKAPAALNAWRAALSVYGSDITKVAKSKSHGHDLLVLFADHPDRLVASLESSKVDIISHNNGASKHRWLAGTRGRQATVACHNTLEELAKPLLRLIDILHAGLPLDCDTVAAAHAKQNSLRVNGRD